MLPSLGRHHPCAQTILQQAVSPTDESGSEMPDGTILPGTTPPLYTARFNESNGVVGHLSRDKVAVQMNDTHPTIAVAEMMRLLAAGLQSRSEATAWDIG